MLKVRFASLLTLHADKGELVQTQKSALTHFMDSYLQHTASRDFPAIEGHFAETFLVAGPTGTQCIRADDFARALPRRAALFESLGCRSTVLTEMQESWIDSRYALVRTNWRFRFGSGHETDEVVDSEATYVVDTASDPYRIVAYLNPRDIMETLRQRGILN